LLEKMSSIMRTRGSVDNHNNYHARSLNKTKRQRELLRLTHENQVRQLSTYGGNSGKASFSIVGRSGDAITKQTS
jgi:hypothetical protein